MKKVLITGAGTGIGFATAMELLDRGHYVYLTVHNDEQLKNINNHHNINHDNLSIFKLDITKEEDRNKVKELDIDVLINNAAIGKGGSIIEAEEKTIRENYEVNVFGTIALTKLVLEGMIKKNSGRIIMITSVQAEIPFAWLGIYASTKAALKNISIALSKELKQLGTAVDLVIVEPGAYYTGFNQVMLENKYDNPDSYFKDIRNKIKLKEKVIFGILEQKDLKTVVEKIVLATEEVSPELIYKAPEIQGYMEKAYIIFKK
jgi:short-subunit dehydrogenase